MGIQGLLPQLKSITTRAHVSKFRGQRAAVDAYVLLHRGAYTCAREIVEGEATDRCTEYCMGRIQMLLAAGVVPVVVFDGGRLPNKDEEEKNRARSRAENKAKARALWQQGNKAAAFECYQRAVDIEPRVAKGFVDALKRKGVEYIVAPYEADAQMAYLALKGMVDVVITEVFFKMSREGDGEEIELKNLVYVRELSFIGFTHDMFQEMCIMAGCDFVKALPGIGIKKAHQQIRQRKSFTKVVKSLRFSSTAVPSDYEKRVQRALWVFQHQRVYCPQRRTVVHLHEVNGGSLAHNALVPSAAELLDGEEDFLGPPLPDDVAQAIAAGDLDPITKQPFVVLAAANDGPCTAPGEDVAAHSSQGSGKNCANVQHTLRQIMEGQDGRVGGMQGQRHRSQGTKPPAPGAGNTLAKYGFLRTSGSARKEFKRPRAASEEPEGRLQQHHQQQQQEQEEVNLEGEQQQNDDDDDVDGPGQTAGAHKQGCHVGQGSVGGSQAFLRSLQVADAQPLIEEDVAARSSFAGVQLGRHRQGQTAAASRPGGALGLLAKLRADLREPQLDEVLPGNRQGSVGLEEDGADLEAEAGLQQLQALSAFGEPSPTLDDLLGESRQPHSPGLGPGWAQPGEPPAQLPVGGGAIGPSSLQQITPGFYGGELERDEPGSAAPAGLQALAEMDAGAAGGDAGSAAIANLGHVQAFAVEARQAMDRMTAQCIKAVQDAGLDNAPLRVLAPPPHLQRRAQQQQASAAALKRPFSVPRKAGMADKENGLGASKRPKADVESNVFSRFVCK